MKTLISLYRKTRVVLFELAGAGTVVYGIAQLSTAAAWIAAGVAVLAKSFELDMRDGDA